MNEKKDRQPSPSHLFRGQPSIEVQEHLLGVVEEGIGIRPPRGVHRSGVVQPHRRHHLHQLEGARDLPPARAPLRGRQPRLLRGVGRGRWRVVAALSIDGSVRLVLILRVSIILVRTSSPNSSKAKLPPCFDGLFHARKVIVSVREFERVLPPLPTSPPNSISLMKSACKTALSER